MFRNWTFGRRLAAGFALAGLVLIVVSAVAYRITTQLIDSSDWVNHTYQVRGNLAELLAGLIDAENGQRGFLLSGDETYLEPYTDALKTIATTFDRVKTLTADNASQHERLAKLSPLIEQRLASLKANIDRRRAAGLDASAETIRSNSGKALMDQIRALLAEADGEEAQLLVERDRDSRDSAQLAIAIVVWGGLAGVIAIALVGWLITSALSRQIGNAVGRVQSSSAELQSAANQQATGIKEQATSMNEITTTISELLATSRQIAESAQRVAQIAEETASAAQSGDGTVGIAHESIAGIRRQVDMVVNHMLELGKKSQQIGSVLDIVSELAEQTNILSINATIEAAGAGEAGKRFAVVADEIRKLADRVGESAKEIRTLIDDVRSSVNTTVMATETGSKAVDAGSKQFGDVASALKSIVGLVTTTTEAAREIELSTKQQTTAVEQVNIAIANVAQAAKESEASTGQTLQTATELASTSHDLLRMVHARARAA